MTHRLPAPLDDLLLDALRQALVPLHHPQAWQDADAQAQASVAVNAIEQRWRQQGFDALMQTEIAGGGGLCVNQLYPVWVLLGELACPLPLGPGLAVQALLQAHQTAPPVSLETAGLTTLAAGVHVTDEGQLQALRVPWGRTAQAVVFDHQDQSWWLSTQEAQVVSSGLSDRLQADLHWSTGLSQARCLGPAWGVPALGAVIWSAHMAGAMSVVLQRSLQHANERQQFGRPIGKFQVIQHHIAVMAEHVHAVHLAAHTACQSLHAKCLPVADLAQAAMSKARASEAVPMVCNLAHAIHGAMGVTQAHPLHHHTRRLHTWRTDFGSERHWQAVLGGLVMQSPASALDFLRQHLSTETPA